jgi:hypothetical protein
MSPECDLVTEPREEPSQGLCHTIPALLAGSAAPDPSSDVKPHRLVSGRGRDMGLNPVFDTLITVSGFPGGGP